MGLPAVVAGLTPRYGNGFMVGADTVVKWLKRQVYGRAGFAPHPSRSDPEVGLGAQKVTLVVALAWCRPAFRLRFSRLGPEPIRQSDLEADITG